jgi:predicted choloylglycine hydrolase
MKLEFDFYDDNMNHFRKTTMHKYISLRQPMTVDQLKMYPVKMAKLTCFPD